MNVISETKVRDTNSYIRQVEIAAPLAVALHTCMV